MKRRQFITAAGLAAASPLASFPGSLTAQQAEREYYEIRLYHQPAGSRKKLLNDYLSDVAIPAYNRLGINPVGAFTVQFGPNIPSLYVVIPHPSLESVFTASSRLLDDSNYMTAGKEFHDVPLSDPAYVRMEKTLLEAFSHMPKIENPPALTEKKESRIIEMRTYESHSEPAGKLKVEMFNEGGEIEIFRQTGLQPFLFGETVIGANMPSLVYMLAFDDIDMRNRAWDAFRDDPAWKELSANERYTNTVSNISDIILRPTAYSQI